MRSNLNLRQLEAFRAVMVSGSVVRAAELLSLTQPAVSRTLAQLELRLGFALFLRKGRRLVPTSEAEALHREVSQLYVGVERVSQVAQDLRHHRAGSLRLAVMPALAHWLVPKVMTQFLSERPMVTVFVQSLPSRQIADLVATHQFDLGIVELPLNKAGVQIESLPPAPIVAVVPSTHALARRRSLDLADIVNERLVLPSPHSYVRFQIDDAFNQMGLTTHSVVETATSPIAFALAAAGAGIALVSSWVPPSHGDESFVVKRLKTRFQSQYGALIPSGGPTPALAAEFVQMLRARMIAA